MYHCNPGPLVSVVLLSKILYVPLSLGTIGDFLEYSMHNKQ